MSESADSDSSPRDVRRVLLPPVIALLCAGAAAGLAVVLPEPRLLPKPWNWAGGAFIVASASLIAWALRTFRSRYTTPVPHKTPSALVTEGPFRLTRNPMYVGLSTALVGIALMIGSAVALAGPAIFVIAIDRAFIAREERTLERLFGRDYIDYKARVRRWL